MMDMLQILAAGGDTASIFIAFVLWGHHGRITRLENRLLN